MCHHWPVKKAIVDLPVRLKGNSKLRYSNSLSLFRPQNKDLGTALQMLLVGVRTHLQQKLATENRHPRETENIFLAGAGPRLCSKKD